MHAKSAGAALICLLLSSAVFLAASGAGIPTFGSPIPIPADGVGRRQLVQLAGVGTVLRGTPSTGALAMITIRTRNPTKAASLVLWERQNDDGSSLLLLSVPPWLDKDLFGATLFFRTGHATSAVAQAQDGNWVELVPVAVVGTTGSLAGATRQTLVGYPVRALGFFVRNQPDVSGKRAYPSVDPNAFSTRTRIARAGWHLLWPAALLTVLMVLSKRQHDRGAL